MIALKHTALIAAAFLLTTASGLYAAEVKTLSITPDLNTVEPLTSKTFRQLIDESKAANERFYHGVTLFQPPRSIYEEYGERYYYDLKALREYLLKGPFRSWREKIENPATRSMVDKGWLTYWVIPTDLSEVPRILKTYEVENPL